MNKLSYGFFAVGFLVACSGNGGTNGAAGSDAENASDSSNENDAAKNDASANDASTLDATANDASQSLIAQCQTMAQNYATLCAGDDVRPCLWNAYAELCVTGETQLLVDSMNCLDKNTCRTFSDANGGVSCLDTLHASEESQASQQFIVNNCTSCGDSNCQSEVGIAEIFPYLPDADIAALSSCVGTACDLDTLVPNCASTVPDLNLFLTCTQ
jgi:hypothetical protein